MLKKNKENKSDIKEELDNKKELSRAKKVLIKFWHITRGVLVSLGLALSSFLFLFVILGFGLYLSYAHSFSTAKIKNNVTQTVFYDKNGDIIYEGYGAKKPKHIALSEIPKVVRDATLAAEDSNFYSHQAIDIKGIARAALGNIKRSKKSGLSKITDLFSEENYDSGGSTITQQLVKNLYLTNEKSFDRKLKEIIYSIELEKKWSKDKVFEEYFNNIYYGEQSLGIKNATENYFGKDVRELSLAEASMLAGITAAPTRLSPVSGNFEEAKKRQEYVLSKMYNLGMITLDKAKETANAPLDLKKESHATTLKYPYFVDYVKKEIALKFGEEALESGGLSVYTTVDPDKQKVAEENIKEYLAKFKYKRASNAAAVVLDNKNENILAMVGGADWETSKVNVATSERQPGSSFKPIVYTAGLLSGYTASTRLVDTRVNFGGIPPYIPRNYDGSYHGNVTVRTALANSLNIPAVEMTKLAGVDKVIDTANKMGISSIDKDAGSYGLSIGLGSAEVKLVELTRAFTVFANQGKLANFTALDKVVDKDNVEIYKAPKLKSDAIDANAAYIMTNILSDNKARSMVFGTSNPLTLKNRPVAAKTGTTDNYTDSWTVGFTPQFTTGVWMGNNDHSPMAKLPGIESAAYVWHDIMDEITANLPPENFPKPEGISEMWINPWTGTAATYNRSPNILEYFMPGTEPKAKIDLSYLNQFRKSY